MGAYERVIKALEALPEDQREFLAAEVLSWIDEMQGPSHLSAEQQEDLRRRLADPGPVASDAEVEAFFSRFRA